MLRWNEDRHATGLVHDGPSGYLTAGLAAAPFPKVTAFQLSMRKAADRKGMEANYTTSDQPPNAAVLILFATSENHSQAGLCFGAAARTIRFFCRFATAGRSTA